MKSICLIIHVVRQASLYKQINMHGHILMMDNKINRLIPLSYPVVDRF